ncbi:MAG: ComF family protein [Chloroflexi bacterium]|nr:ComF family protein [Chloroflexota bacterium]
MKFKRDLGLPELILPDLVALIEKSGFPVDCLIPVPLSKKRLKQRGYNQVVLWGIPLGKVLGIPFNTTILTQTKETASQVSLSAEERWKNIRGAFSVDIDQVEGKDILILDDVITTGATLDECARVLRKAGARKISALTIARSTIKNHHPQ